MSVDPRHIPKGKDELKRCLSDKMWRMHNLYYIKAKDGSKIKFIPNESQREVLTDPHPLKLILKARQLGMTTLIQLDMLDECLFNPHQNAGVVAHNRNDAEKFFDDKIKFAYDNLPAFLKNMPELKQEASSARELKFGNKSSIYVGVSLRSGTYQHLHVSEYGKLCAKHPDKAEEVKTGALNTVEKGQRIWIESTAEGRGGHFYKMTMDCMREQQQGVQLTEMDFKLYFFPWFNDYNYKLDGDIELPGELEDYFAELQRNHGIVVDQERRNWYFKKWKTQGDKMTQEYPSHPEEAFSGGVDGSYFKSQMEQVRKGGRILKFNVDPTVPVQTFWDLGRDTTAIWFLQKRGVEHCFINYYERPGEDIAYFINVLREMRTEGDRPYLYGTCYLPHDGSRKSVLTKYSAQDQLVSAGFDVAVLPRTNDKSISIARARKAIPMCLYHSVNCDIGITHLDNYRKEWDAKYSTFKKNPVHDEASHGADAFMVYSDSVFLYEDVTDERYGDDGYGDDGGYGHSGANATTGY